MKSLPLWKRPANSRPPSSLRVIERPQVPHTSCNRNVGRAPVSPRTELIVSFSSMPYTSWISLNEEKGVILDLSYACIGQAIETSEKTLLWLQT